MQIDIFCLAMYGTLLTPVPQERVSAEIRQGQATMDGLVIRSLKAIWS
jgi:hypothetical protein